jgi:hypothetical protein
MAVLTDHDKRVVRVQRLADELHAKASIDTDKVRQRCLAIAQELTELFKAENRFHEAERKTENHSLIARARAAQKRSQELLQQTQLPRLDVEKPPRRPGDA